MQPIELVFIHYLFIIILYFDYTNRVCHIFIKYSEYTVFAEF